MTSDGYTTRRDLLRTGAVTTSIGILGTAGCIGQGDTGSGSRNQTDGTGSGSESSGPKAQLVYAGGEQAGATYQMASGMAQVVRQQTNNRITFNLQTTGGTEEDFRGITDEIFDMCAATTPSIWRAASGKDPFNKKHDLNIMFTTAVFPFPIAYTITENEDINYMEDLEGKTMATGPPGDTGHFYWVAYCKANGIDLDSMKFQRITSDEGFRLLNDGRVDGVISGATNDSPGPAAQQWLARTDGAKLVVPKTSERSLKLGEYVGGGIVWDLKLENFESAWENSVVSEENTYKFIAGTDTQTTSIDRISDEVAYEITKLTIEHREKLIDYHNLWGGFANDVGKFAMAMRMQDAEAAPYVPGAARAMKEAGIWNDEFPVAERE